MSSFEWNKIIGAVLVALLAIKTFDILGNGLVHPTALEQNVYVVAGVAEAAPTTAAAQAAPAAPEPIGPLLAAANVDAGKKAANKCAACHTFDKGGANKVGPNLWGVVGADKGHVDGYAYSTAMQKAEGNWDYETLSAFLASPKAVVPGTKMAFAGVSRTSERAEIIAFLRSLSDNPAPLP